MKSLKLACLYLLFLSLVSCESFEVIDIIVIDYSSGLPLDSVYVDIGSGTNGNYTQSGLTGYTDSLGRFNGDFMEGFRYVSRTKITKEGYNPLTLQNEYRDTIYLSPL